MSEDAATCISRLLANPNQQDMLVELRQLYSADRFPLKTLLCLLALMLSRNYQLCHQLQNKCRSVYHMELS